MKLLKSHPILSIANSFVIDSPSPSNLSYLWNYGSLLGLCLVMQIVTGVTLAMHYCPSIDFAFLSVEHIILLAGVNVSPTVFCEQVSMYLAIELQSFAVYILDFSISNFTVFCEEITDDPTAALPHILEFGNLHCTDAFKAMITELKGVAGVYAIIHIASRKAYIGSTQNIGLRLMSHLVYGSCNPHLQNALALYGLSAFVVRLVEEYIFDPNLTDEENAANLLALEQRWLNWLFALPRTYRYNNLPVAGSSLGYSHTESAKAKMSAAKAGEQHPNYGKNSSEKTRALMSAAKAGENNPNYGNTASEETRALMSAAKAGNTHATKSVSVYTLDGAFVQSFPSGSAAAEFLGITPRAVSNAIKRNSVVKRLYRVSFSIQ